jgi:hypothetical protein
MQDISALLVPEVQPVDRAPGTLERADKKSGYATGIERFSRLENSRVSGGKDQRIENRGLAPMLSRSLAREAAVKSSSWSPWEAMLDLHTLACRLGHSGRRRCPNASTPSLKSSAERCKAFT